jgi:hypothetical protein
VEQISNDLIGKEELHRLVEILSEGHLLNCYFPAIPTFYTENPPLEIYMFRGNVNNAALVFLGYF